MEAYLVAEKVLEHAVRIECGEKPDGAELARFIKTLTQLEVEEGGPYAMVRGGETDIGMNLVIARFLGAIGVRLPKLDTYINEAVEKRARSRIFNDDQLAELIAWRSTSPEPQRQMALTPDEDRAMALIREAAQLRFAELPAFMQENAHAAIERTIEGNVDMQMSLMALYVRQALGSKGKHFDDEYIAQLGLANIFFWTAFIAYDDFWDEDEAADRNVLPIANLFARHYTDVFTHLLPKEKSFREFFHVEMDRLDAANAWEISSCRARVEQGVFHVPSALPEYGDFSIKFHPAAGHVLGPVALFSGCGYDLKSAEVIHLMEYFRHYLIAMQLNDDMHDWKEDLARGHISTAVSVLLSKWQNKYPERNCFDLVRDMPELEHIFWFESLKPLCECALMHAAKSRAALERISCIENPAPLEKYIRRNEVVVREALSAHGTSNDFLRIFS
jgi:hypothetical protein